MIKYILVVFCVFNVFSCSKLREDEVEKINKQYINSLKENMFSDPAKAVVFSKKFIKFNKKQNNNDNILLGYGCLTMAFYNLNSLDSIMYYTKETLEHAKKPNDIFLIKRDLADVYHEYNLKEAALFTYEECLRIVEDNKLSKDKAEAINNDINFLRYEIHEVKNRALNGRMKAYDEAIKGDDIKQIRYARLSLVKSYLDHNLPEKTFELIEEGLSDAENRSNVRFQYLLNRMKAKAYLQMDNFKLAYKSIRTAKEIIKRVGHKKYTIEAEYVLALIYQKQGRHYLQVNVLEDIICENKGDIFERFSKYYQLLAHGYLQLGNIDLYIENNEAYKAELELEVERNLKTLAKSHDIVETIKAKLANDKKNNWIIAFLIVCVILLILFIRNKNIEKKNKRLFNNLMDKIKTFEAQELKTEPLLKIAGRGLINAGEDKLEDKEEEAISNITDDKVNEILEKLKKLETKHYFLKQNCTLHNTAKKLKTNTSYLSKIINAHLGKNFSAYINELRINYAIIELKQNKRLRAYTIKAIAEELGYKKSGAFSKYFKDATGITPSVYIKNLPEL